MISIYNLYFFILLYGQDHNAKVGTFLSFGAGSMYCPGSDLAKIEISVFLHHFLLNYK